MNYFLNILSLSLHIHRFKRLEGTRITALLQETKASMKRLMNEESHLQESLKQPEQTPSSRARKAVTSEELEDEELIRESTLQRIQELRVCVHVGICVHVCVRVDWLEKYISIEKLFTYNVLIYISSSELTYANIHFRMSLRSCEQSLNYTRYET